MDAHELLEINWASPMVIPLISRPNFQFSTSSVAAEKPCVVLFANFKGLSKKCSKFGFHYGTVIFEGLKSL